MKHDLIKAANRRIRRDALLRRAIRCTVAAVAVATFWAVNW